MAERFDTEKEKRYVKWRNVANDLLAGPWVVWDELGPYPTQEQFIQGLIGCNLDPHFLSTKGIYNEPLSDVYGDIFGDDHSGLINFGLREQFYIPDIHGWDMSKFDFDIDDEIAVEKEHIISAPVLRKDSKDNR